MTIFAGEARLAPEAPPNLAQPASYGEYLSAVAGAAVDYMPSVELFRMDELAAARGEMPLARVFGFPIYGAMPDAARIPEVPMAEARERVKAAGLEQTLKLPEAPSIKTPALEIMMSRAKERREREDVIARGPTGFVSGALGVGTSFLVSALDPLNIAAAFVPVVGAARYAKLLAPAGRSVLGRAGVRAAVGATEGAVGFAALEPLHAYAVTQEGQDYTLAQSLRNIAFGAGLGASLRGVGGAIADVLRTRKGRPLYPFDAREPADAFPPYETLRPEAAEAGAPVDPFGRLADLPELPERPPTAPAAAEAPALTPAAAAIADLPPRAQEDVLRGAIASLARGEKVVAAEHLAAAAEVDPRIAESFALAAQEGTALRPPPDAAARWNELARERPPHVEPDAVAALTVAEALPPPDSLTPFERAPGRARSASRSAAEEAENIAIENYRSALEEGRIADSERLRHEKALAEIDQEAQARVSALRDGAGCLIAGLGLG